MPLSREDILASNTFPIDTIEAFGGTVRITGIPMGDPDYNAYINAPVERPTLPADIADLVPQGGSAAERAAATAATSVAREALARAWATPSEEEVRNRKFVAAVILGTIDDNGNRLFTFADADALRRLHWVDVCRVAAAIFDLTRGVAPDGSDTEEAEPLEASKSVPA